MLDDKLKLGLSKEHDSSQNKGIQTSDQVPDSWSTGQSKFGQLWAWPRNWHTGCFGVFLSGKGICWGFFFFSPKPSTIDAGTGSVYIGLLPRPS